MKKIKKILFLIQLPPPVHGVSVMNKAVISNPYFNSFDKKTIPLNFSKEISSLRKFTFKKVVKSIFIFFKIFSNLFVFRPNVVYFTLFPFGKAFFLRDIFYLGLIKIFNIKIVLHFHNVGIKNESKNRFKQRIYNWAFSNLNIIFLFEKLKEKEIANLSLKNTRYFVIPNGIPVVDISKYNNIKEEKDYLNILFFSNLFEEKGFFLLLDVFKELSKKNDNIKLIIAGQDFDNNKQKIEKLIYQYSLQKSVIIKTNTFNEQKYELYAKSDIFVFPSFFKEEAFPLVVLEAMQMQLAIVASDIGATSNIIQNGQNGLLLKSNNHQDLFDKIKMLILDKNLRKKLGIQAMVDYKEKYTTDIFNNNVVNVIKTLIND